MDHQHNHNHDHQQRKEKVNIGVTYIRLIKTKNLCGLQDSSNFSGINVKLTYWSISNSGTIFVKSKPPNDSPI